MHAYRAFIQAEMDRRGWKAADLATKSGVSKQVISTALRDSRDQLRMMPSKATVQGLARAFDVPDVVVLQKIAEAMGLPAGERVVVYDPAGVPDDELVREVARRLRASTAGRAQHGAADVPVGAVIADAIEPDEERARGASQRSTRGLGRGGRG